MCQCVFFPFLCVFMCVGEFLGASQGNQDIHFQPQCTSARTKGCSYTLKIIPYSLVTKARTMKHPVNEGSMIQSVLTQVWCLCCYCHLWNKRGLTMPARTLGSWEAMTSVIISGNSTFIESAWMKVLRQNRLIFFTICHTRDISHLGFYPVEQQQSG